jgi:hypothetical protein
MPVKYRCDLRRWVFDRDGVSEAVAAEHGYRGNPWREPDRRRQRQLERDIARTAVELERQRQKHLAALAAAAETAAALKAEKAAASRERARIKRKIYFAAYYALNRERIAARRKAQRQAARPIT